MTARLCRPAAHPQEPKALFVPRSVVDATCKSFAEYRAMRMESVVYWYGLECKNADAVVPLAIPDAHRGEFHYRADAESVAKMTRSMIQRSPVCLAQFRTHQGQGTAHSHTDDREAMSGKSGFRSLVAPHYGPIEGAFPDSVSVHEACGGGTWRLLGDFEKMGRVRMIDDVVDARRGA